MATIEVTEDTFDSQVLQADKPVLVDFWAAWCAPCRQVAPVLEALSEEYRDHLLVAKVDVDRAPLLSDRFRIQSIPTMILFRDGQPVQALAGAYPKPALEEFLGQHIPGLAPPTIDVKALATRLDEGFATALFDLRPEVDFARSHLRRSKVVSMEDLNGEIERLSDDTLVVLVDRAGKESEEAAKSVSKPNVVALSGGILEWQGSQLPTYSNDEEAELDASENA